MTREELFRAVGEVREDRIIEAETVQWKKPFRRRYGAAAACLAIVLTALAMPCLRDAVQWSRNTFRPAVDADQGGVQAGALDGSEYWPDPAAPASYSVNAEIGELAGPGAEELGGGSASMVRWRSPEEIFAEETEIFRGTVRELQYFQVTVSGIRQYYTRAIVEVTDPIRSGLAEGAVRSLLYMGARGYMASSLSGPLNRLEEGSDAIFMPVQTSPDTGWRTGTDYFCYADLADLYLSEGMRYVFLDTGKGLDFSQSTYTALAEAETLEQAAAYIRSVLEAQSLSGGADAAAEEADSET